MLISLHGASQGASALSCECQRVIDRPPVATAGAILRRRILLAFEAAETESDPGERSRLLNFVVVGGGPTGVELAGAIAELAKRVLASDFRAIDPRQSRIILIEAGPRLLAPFDPELSEAARRS